MSEKSPKNSDEKVNQYNRGDIPEPAESPKKKKMSLIWYIVAGVSLMIIGAAIALVLSRSGKEAGPSDNGTGDSHAVVNNETTASPASNTPVTTAAPVTASPTTEAPSVTAVPTTAAPVTAVLSTEVPSSEVPPTEMPSSEVPSTEMPSSEVPTTEVPITEVPTTPVWVITPLVIVQQPVSVTVHEGENAVFTVVAQGDGVQYEWEASYDSGTTWGSWDQYTSSITVYGKPNRDGRLFRCKVWDRYGNTIYSDVAVMGVIVQSTPAPLVIVQQPASVTVHEGENAVFTVVAEGDGVQYEWEASYDSGTTWGSWDQYTSSITVYGKENRNGRLFRCKVWDQYGNTIYSDVAVMGVISP